MAEKSSKKSKIDAEMVRQLAELLDETGLSEIEYGTDEWHLRVAKGGVATTTVTTQAAAPASAAPAPAAKAETTAAADDGEHHADHPGVVVSPMVGTAYTSPDPESAAFVKVGDMVEEGDAVGEAVGQQPNVERALDRVERQCVGLHRHAGLGSGVDELDHSGPS